MPMIDFITSGTKVTHPFAKRKYHNVLHFNTVLQILKKLLLFLLLIFILLLFYLSYFYNIMMNFIENRFWNRLKQRSTLYHSSFLDFVFVFDFILVLLLLNRQILHTFRALLIFLNFPNNFIIPEMQMSQFISSLEVTIPPVCISI